MARWGRSELYTGPRYRNSSIEKARSVIPYGPRRANASSYACPDRALTGGSSRRHPGWPLFLSAEVQNELADALTDKAVKAIISAMNSLPDDILSYVMAYTPVRRLVNYHKRLVFIT